MQNQRSQSSFCTTCTSFCSILLSFALAPQPVVLPVFTFIVQHTLQSRQQPVQAAAQMHLQTAANMLVTNCKPQRLVWCRIRAQQSAVDASMPEWVFTDLQQRLNAAQQLLTQQSMTYEQGHLAGTWPRSRPRSPARRGMQQLLLQHCVFKI